MKVERGLALPQNQDPVERAAKQDHQLREAAKMYEQHFMREMVKAMRQASPEGGLVEKSMGEKIYSEQLDQQYVENWSGRGGVGLADLIYNNIRERYFPSAENLLPPPKGPLPLEKKNELTPADWKAKPLPLDQDKDLSLRFEGGDSTPQQVHSPWSGKVEKAFNTPDGMASIDIRHDQGLVSRMVFPGAVDGRLEGLEVQAGATLGQVRGSAPWLQWNLSKGQSPDSTS